MPLDDEDSDDGLDIFVEPDGYFEPEKPFTYEEYQLRDGRTLNLRLVGHNPLWGHLLWNAGRAIAAHIEEHAAVLVHDKTVLELGAGAGLPSLTCAIHGAKQVVVTDYPDAELIDNLTHNISACQHLPRPANIWAEGYLWGAAISPLTAHLPAPDPTARPSRFDVLILADLLFNHSEHVKLARTVRTALARTRAAKALVFFTPYRPWLLHKDLAFFDLARQGETDDGYGGLHVEKIMEQVLPDVMFEDDPGDERLRRTVFGYELTWADLRL